MRISFIIACALFCIHAFADTAEPQTYFVVKRGQIEILPLEKLKEPPPFLASEKTVKLISKKFKKLFRSDDTDRGFTSALAINILSDETITYAGFYRGGQFGKLLCFFSAAGQLKTCEDSYGDIGWDGRREIFVDLGGSKVFERIVMERAEESEDYFAVSDFNPKTLNSRKLFDFIPVAEYSRKEGVVNYGSENFTIQGAKIDLSYEDGNIQIRSLPRHCMARTEDAGAAFTGIETMRMPLIHFLMPVKSNENSFDGPPLGHYKLSDLEKSAAAVTEDLTCKKDSDCKIVEYAGKKLIANKTFSVPEICKNANTSWQRMSWDHTGHKPQCLRPEGKKNKFCY